MKNLILYDSKYGFTKKVAEFIESKLEDVELISMNDFTRSLKNYENIFIGGYVYKGRVSSVTTSFLTQYKMELLKKQLFMFCSALDKSDFNHALQESIHPDIFYHAKIINCGVQIDFRKLNKSEKKELKKRFDVVEDIYVYDEQEIIEFINMSKKTIPSSKKW